MKSLSAFYKHSGMLDGHLNICKDCKKKYSIVNRLSKVEYYREYDRERGNRQSLEELHKYREENPKKYAAHVKVGNAIRDGKLVPQPCQVCSGLKVHAHHCDYDKPLEVLWLCSEHHVAWHKDNGEGLNA